MTFEIDNIEVSITECGRCGYKKDWEGSDIDCPFQDSEKFKKDWNCGMVSKIRDLCELAMEGKDYRLHYQFCDDQKYVTIRTDDIDDMGLCLWVSWYKNRGGTDAMWILDSYSPPRTPSFSDLNVITLFYYDLLTDKK